MEIPKPPTDTIYKFLAIFGLTIFISSLATPFWMFQKLDSLLVENTRDLKLLNLDAGAWQQAFERVKKASEEHTAASKQVQDSFDDYTRTKSPGSKAAVERAIASARVAYDTFQTSSKDFEEKTVKWQKQRIDVEYKTNLYEIRESTASRIADYCVVGLLFGLVMTITGFILWYKRGQKPEDLILKKKTEEKSVIIRS